MILRPTVRGAGRRPWPALRADGLAIALLVLFVGAALVAPAAALFRSSLMAGGRPSLEVYARILMAGGYQRAIVTSLALAATAATLGSVLGGVVALSLHRIAGDRFRGLFLSLAAVATNYGGVPLAFGFILLLGSQGAITLLLSSLVGRHLPVELVSFWGLVLVYLYFLIPLCILTFLPALVALRSELRDAASVHGGRAIHFWRYVGGPILLPPLTASFVLLFAHALGSFTTPWAIVGGGSDLTLMTLQIGFLFGEAGFDLEAADALAVLIMLLAGASLLIYRLLMSRVARWLG